jgi:hypothetical protein
MPTTARLAAASLLLLAACASVPRGSDRLAQQAQVFIPPAGKANLYVIRPYNFDNSLWIITLDFSELGTLGLRSYLYGPIDPGDHFLGTVSLGSEFHGASPKRRFTAEPGRNYFFKVSSGWGSMEFDPLEEAEGRKRVTDYTLSGDSRFELLKEPAPR